MQTLWLSNPNLSIDYARNESVESQLSAGEPYHTLCLVGYTGDKYGLRRILGDFRQAIRDVRIREQPYLAVQLKSLLTALQPQSMKRQTAGTLSLYSSRTRTALSKPEKNWQNCPTSAPGMRAPKINRLADLF